MEDMSKLPAPIKMYGGKGTMFKNIIKHFPRPDEYDTYIEPFGGSFVIGLNIPTSNIEIYNDLEQNVYSLYKVLSDPELFERFKYRCDLVLYSEDIRKEYIEYLKIEDLSLVDRAFYYFYVNRTSVNGSGGFSVSSHIRRGMSKSISDFLSAIDRLPELHDRLSRVMVLNTDGTKLIRRFNNDRVLIYADPPYHQSTRTSARYKIDMNNDQQVDFIDSVIKSKCKIIISGYDCELYDTLVENGFTKIHFNVNTTDIKFKPKTKVETLFKNF
jgi:DNA adenine methylase